MSRGFDGRDSGRPKPRPAGHGSEDHSRGAKPLSEILGDLFAAKGLARVQATGALHAAWAEAIGEPGRRHTRVDGLRRGILSVTVAHPTLLAELASFQKPNLLAALRKSLVGTPVLDIRFRVGPIEGDGTSDPPKSPRPGRRD